MAAISTRARVALFAFGSIAIALGLCVTVVPETSQAVIMRMGEPVRVINRWTPANTPATKTTGGGGLIAHLPFVEHVEWIERGLFGFTTDRVPVRGTDQFPLLIDATATLRVFDPVKLVGSAGNTDKAVAQLSDAVRSLAQQELGTVDATRMLMPGSGGATARLRAALDTRARLLGIQVVDLRLAAANLPEGELQQAYERMEAERNRIAASETDSGTREADRIGAEGKAEAARILGAAAGKDPGFYDFYRAMQSYEMVFASDRTKGSSTIILGPDSEYLKQFKGQ
ncbi:MAG: protease modulator HflC [Sphingomonadales bacterium]|nr:protease modulator HflC [Sphingomonadales bacterium]